MSAVSSFVIARQSNGLHREWLNGQCHVAHATMTQCKGFALFFPVVCVSVSTSSAPRCHCAHWIAPAFLNSNPTIYIRKSIGRAVFQRIHHVRVRGGGCVSARCYVSIELKTSLVYKTCARWRRLWLMRCRLYCLVLPSTMGFARPDTFRNYFSLVQWDWAFGGCEIARITLSLPPPPLPFSLSISIRLFRVYLDPKRE